MIDFRYHLVSIIAVFLALGLGLFIGSTSLQNAVVGNIENQVKTANSQNQALQKRLANQGKQQLRDSAFIDSVAPFAVENRLTPVQSVSVISLPGVSGSTADAIAKLVQEANGTVASQVDLQPDFVNPSSSTQTLLTSLASRLRPTGVHLPVGGTGSQRAAAELAAVLATKPGGSSVPAAQAQSVLSAFADANMINVHGAVSDIRPASLTVLLVPAPSGVAKGDGTSVSNVAAALQHDLSADAVGAVVAGPAGAAQSSGLLSQAKSAAGRPANLATVQSADTTGGQVAVIFALVEVFEGRSGDFGPGSDSPLPSPSPSP